MSDSATPSIAHQAHLSFTISQSLLKFMSIESVMLFLKMVHIKKSLKKREKKLVTKGSQACGTLRNEDSSRTQTS